MPTIRDGKLYGRGAADMKSSIAAFVIATEMFLKERPQHSGSIALLLTSDEEGPAIDGTLRVVETLKRARRGARLLHRRRAHLGGRARRHDEERPPRLALRQARGARHPGPCRLSAPRQESRSISLAPALAELAKAQWDKGNESFPPTSFQVSNIHGGTGAANVVPGAVEVDFNFRFSTESTEASLKSRVEAILRKHGLDYALSWVLGAKPFLSGRGRLAQTVIAAGKKHTGRSAELSTTGGTSDARFIIEICPEVIELGPVNASIHKLNEHISLAELEQLPRIYLETLRALLP